MSVLSLNSLTFGMKSTDATGKSSPLPYNQSWKSSIGQEINGLWVYAQSDEAMSRQKSRMMFWFASGLRSNSVSKTGYPVRDLSQKDLCSSVSLSSGSTPKKMLRLAKSSSFPSLKSVMSFACWIGLSSLSSASTGIYLDICVPK